MLINECNALRTENRELKAQLSQLQSEMRAPAHAPTPPRGVRGLPSAVVAVGSAGDRTDP